MSNIYTLLSDYSSLTILILIGMFLLVILSKEILKYKIKMKELHMKHKSTVSEKDDDTKTVIKGNNNIITLTDSSNLVDFNFKVLERYYEESLVEYKIMSRSSLIISIIGFIVIIIGVFLAYANLTTASVITSISGLVTEAASMLFFKQNKLIADQIKEYHKKLVSTQYLLTSISLSKELPESNSIASKEYIIQNLLYLSNELHDAKSIHLFNEKK